MPNDHDATKRPQSRFAAGAVEISAMPITMVDEPQAGDDMLNTAVMIAQAIRDAEICAGCGDSLQNHNSVNLQCADGHGTFVAASRVEKIDARFAAAHYGNDLHPQPDVVNHPSHYTSGKVECIDALEAATSGLSGIEAVCTANAIKYLWRWKQKNGLEDLRKARWYINKMLGDPQ